MLSQQLIDELDVILKDDYQTCLSKQELFDIAEKLTTFFDLLAKFDCQDRTERNQNDK